MPRELSAEVEAIKDSQRFAYYDVAEITLPFGPGDVTPRVLRVATAEIEVLPSLDFTEFVYKAFAGALGRASLSSERTDWIEALLLALETSEAALVTEAVGLIDGLFTSTDYDDRMRNDDQFISDLYAAFLGRVAETGGKTFWLAQIAAHDRAWVRARFGEAEEFAERIALLSQPAAQESDVREMGDLPFSDGAAIDGVSFSLTNAENTYSNLLGQQGRRLHPAPAVVSRVFRLADNTYSPVVMMVGFAKFSGVDGENAKVTINSDLNRRGVDMVKSVSQHCDLVYKMGGCDSPDPSLTCSHIEDDATNGCASKLPAPQIIDASPPDNRPSFSGVSQPPATTSSPTPVGIDPVGAGPGGWPDDEYDPFDPRRRRTRVAFLDV
jgi:hypothetical protein